MSPRAEGILDGQDWDEVKPEQRPEWTHWTPAAMLRRQKRILGRIMSFLWPKVPPAPEKLRSTAYLDGLKGFAAFLVYWHHHELWPHEISKQNSIFQNGFGYDGAYQLAAFPGLRNFFGGGHYAVAIFFVISGYVLSAKPLSLIQAGDFLTLGDNLASALFRRWLRLFLPLIITTFVYMSSLHLFGITVHGLTLESNWCAEFVRWFTNFRKFSYIFREMDGTWPTYNTYNFHLWSIPVELKGSIVVYTTLMAFSRATKNARLIGELVLIFYLMYIVDGSRYALFVAGMLLCDLDLLAKRDELPPFLTRLEPYKTFIFYSLFVVSFYLGGVPCDTEDILQLSMNRGWYWLSFLKPEALKDYKWFYLFWAAVFLVAAVPRIRWLKGFFETRFCQYLGRVCFSLYLVHGPVISTLGDRIYFAVGWETEERRRALPGWQGLFPLSQNGPVGLEPAFLLPHIILLPVTMWLAEIVTRGVDEPSIKFASWLYKRIRPEQPQQSQPPRQVNAEEEQ